MNWLTGSGQGCWAARAIRSASSSGMSGTSTDRELPAFIVGAVCKCSPCTGRQICVWWWCGAKSFGQSFRFPRLRRWHGVEDYGRWKALEMWEHRRLWHQEMMAAPGTWNIPMESSIPQSILTTKRSPSRTKGARLWPTLLAYTAIALGSSSWCPSRNPEAQSLAATLGAHLQGN